jgi:Glycosyl hydrolase family 95 catalytic domain/Glycoside hydrolase family 95, C-terminal domain
MSLARESYFACVFTRVDYHNHFLIANVEGIMDSNIWFIMKIDSHKLVCSIALAFILCESAFAQRTPDDGSQIDFRALVSRADINYDKPVSRTEEGLPIGNGVMGSLVWTTPFALHFQLNRVDVFGNNSASNNFYERHTDYCGGLGFVDVEFINGVSPVFGGKDFQEHLSCYDGVVSTEGKGVSVRTMVWQKQDVMAMQVEDSRANPLPILINLRSLRLPITKRGDHEAISSVVFSGNKIILTQKFKEGDYYNGSAVVIGTTGRETIASVENPSTARIAAAQGNSPLRIFMATAASFDPSEDIVAIASQKIEAAETIGFEEILRESQAWWKDYWHRSFVVLHSDDGVADFAERNYTYYRYVMASSSRGKYPTKFNGMLWTTGGDERKWGNLFWGANQSCLYNALFQTNNLELLDPMFNMYSSALDGFALAAQQQWGSRGLFIPETVAFNGMPNLPDDIAAEMRDLYLVKKPWEDRSEKFVSYAYTKMPFLSRWNWKKDEGWANGIWKISDKGGGTFGHVTHIFSRGAKIAYQYWLKYEYTQDKAWLGNRAYPVIKGVAEFYRNFPNVKKEGDGKYHIRHVNDNESIWGGHNTIEEISSMMGIFPVAIKAAEILHVDAELRASWKEFVGNLAPIPLSTDYPQIDGEHKVTWVRSLPPMVQGNGNRIPDPNTMPVWFFDLCTLESGQDQRKLANATYDAYFPDGIDQETKVNVLSKLPASGALLGRTESTRYLVPNQIATAETEVLSNRMDLREGNQTTSIQRLGRAAEALQYALCQSVPAGPGQAPVIHVFPAWPPEWNASYSLLCRGAFLVGSSMKSGEIEFVRIQSQAGQPCRIRNPWPGSQVTITRNGKKWRRSTAEMISFPTSKEDHFLLLKGSR